MELIHRNYTNVTRHMTTTRQGHVLMASLTFTGLIGGEEGTSERANCILLTMGHEPHLILILVWFALFLLSISRGVLDSGRFLYPPFWYTG